MDKVEFTHLEKIFWPSEKYTKGDFIEYYSSVAKYIVPYLKNRPITLHRYPRGIQNEGFFQKNLEDHPSWIKTISIEHEDKTVHYPLIPDIPSLLYLANYDSIDFHPFHSSISSLKHPDYLVLDLDPEKVDFSDVVETALVIHDILEKAKIKNFCKTSGGRGLHIYIPLDGSLDYDKTKDIARNIAQATLEQLPKLISLERMPAKRQGKVYVDFLRNSFGQTAVSVYSVRPLPHAPVSTPLEWKEVKKGLSPLNFTIKSVPKRLASKGDSFKGILKKSSVTNLLKNFGL